MLGSRSIFISPSRAYADNVVCVLYSYMRYAWYGAINNAVVDEEQARPWICTVVLAALATFQRGPVPLVTAQEM